MAEPELPPFKTCSKCGEAKPLDLANFRARKSGRFYGYCRACARSYSNHWYEQNCEYVSGREKARYAADPEPRLIKNKEWRVRNRDAINAKNAADYKDKPNKKMANDRWKTANPEKYRASI